MALEEKISKHLGKPYIYLKDKKKFLCQNGVLFTLDEYKNGIDINKEYERRLREDTLYDYIYAKNTGILRKKRGTKHSGSDTSSESTNRLSEVSSVDVQPENTAKDVDRCDTNRSNEVERTVRLDTDRDIGNVMHKTITTEIAREKTQTAIWFIVILLGFTSLISGYISTLHTATYLYDYVDVFSAWLMSASVTAYNATAFEVSVIFKSKRRFGLAFIFITLWAMVTLFSMATTVSVFYDRFNFIETQIALENKQTDSNKLALELLQKKESDLRESIEFKKKDIEYRQEKDYATTAVRTELNELQEELQKNLSEQQQLLQETPEVTEKAAKRKESLFAFLGRLMKIEGGVLEFIMSTMSAIFINIISPMSLVAVAEIKTKKKRTLD